MSLEKIIIPDLGDSEDVEVIEILVSPGDEIQENDSILVLETDKAAMEIPSTGAGVIKEVLVKVGDTVNQGHEIIVLETISGDSTKAEVEETPEKTPEKESDPVKEETPVEDSAASKASTQQAIAEIVIPDLGTDDAVEVIDVLVAVGDEVSADDGLATLETDKAAMDLPAPFSGKITDIKIKVGDTVTTGTVIMLAETSAGVSAPVPAAEKIEVAKSEPVQSEESAPASVANTVTPAANSAVSKASSDVYAGPAVRKLARQLGVDLAQVTGTGTRARILKEDVHVYVKNAMQDGGTAVASSGLGIPTIPDMDFSRFGELEEVDMSKLHQVTARNMSQSWLNVPHVTQFEEADITDLEDFRASLKSQAEKRGIKLSPLPFIVKISAQALAEFPQFNVSLHSSGKKLIQKKYVHIGVAVATPAGLMVPVIKNADQKSVWDIAAEIAELGNLAKDRKLTREQMEGGCFTVSSLGNLGGSGFTPIVNAPEVAILGVSKTTLKPVWMNNEFVPRKMLPFSLSYDHRAVNGVDGGMFCSYINNMLSDIRNMIL